MADNSFEGGLRRRAIKLHQRGLGFNRILERLGRGRSWLAKWLGRFRQGGWARLESRSRAPKRRPARMPPRVVVKVLQMRAELQAHRSR